MKALCIFLLLVLPKALAEGQSSFYPLGSADSWVYWEFDQYGGVWDTIWVVTEGDTPVAGHVYKIHNHISARYRYDAPLLSFERVDSSGDVFIWDEAARRDTLYYRLNDTSHTWWFGQMGLQRFDSCAVREIFGKPRNVLYVGNYSVLDTTLLSVAMLVDSIGYYTTDFYGIVDGTSPPVLQRAIINGVFYGTAGGGKGSQNAYFPLHIGDSWQYFQIVDPNPSHPVVDVQQTTVTGHILMPNGHHYAVLNDWGVQVYMRQQGDSVFVWSPNGEWLYFDFSRMPGDTTYTSGGMSGDTVYVITDSRDTMDIFGSRRCTWRFGFDNPHVIDEEGSYLVVDSIGVTDINLGFGGPYNFRGARINGIYYGNYTSVKRRPEDLPELFALEQNYPNPFNPLTIVHYTVGGAGGSGLGARNTRLVVYDLLGREVAVLVNEKKEPGSYEVSFDASGLSSGVYIYRLTAGAFMQSRTMILMK